MVSKDAYKRVFDDFDEKNQGYLRRQETSDAIRCCGFNPTEDQIRKAIKS